jgi:hypothetical protein
MSKEVKLRTGMKAWRLQYPRATRREREKTMDERLAQRRAGILGALVKRSPQADGSQITPENRPGNERVETCASARANDVGGGTPVEVTGSRRSAALGPQCGHRLCLTRYGMIEQCSHRAGTRGIGPVLCLRAPVGWSTEYAREPGERTLQAGKAAVQKWEKHTEKLKPCRPQAPTGALRGVGVEVHTWVSGETHAMHRSRNARLVRGSAMCRGLSKQRARKPIGVGWNRRVKWQR